MSLVKSRELFVESAFPITVDTVVDRTLIHEELHRHDFFELLYVERGSLINRFKDTEIRMKPGDVLIMKPYVMHVLETYRKSVNRKAYCCSFLPQTIDCSIQSLDELKVSNSPNKYYFKSFLSLVEMDISAVQIRADAENRKRLSGLFQQLRETSHDHTDKGNALTRFHFLNLLIFLSEQFEKGQAMNRTVRIDMSVPVSRYQTGMRKTLSYIHDHFEKPISLREMAAMSGASETYFCRLFKHETGMTFLNYLNSLRIDRACVLLRDTCDNALDICYRVGFNDYTHFGRQFKKHTGMSPADFRRLKQRVHQIIES